MTLYIYYFKPPSSNSGWWSLITCICSWCLLFLNLFLYNFLTLSVLHPLLHLSCSPSISSDRDRFHYCSQSGPSGQLLCSTVHLNIILLIKAFPPYITTTTTAAAALLPPLPFSHTAPAFCSPRNSPTRFMSSHALAIWKEETSPLSLPLSCGFNLCRNIADSVFVCEGVRVRACVCVRVTAFCEVHPA